MADEVEIEPEFEDDDDFNTRLDELAQRRKKPDNSPDTTAPEGAPPVEEANIPQRTQRFTGKRRDKENKKLVEQAQKEAERNRRRDQAEARRVLREQQQDQTREQRIQSRETLRLSREQVTATRSDAIAGRVQSYSLAASIGFPGYVAASVVDSLYIRPKEEANVNAQKEYQRQLEVYNEQVRKDQIEERRRQEQAIRDMPIDATSIDPRTGKPVKNPPLPPSGLPPTPPTPPSNVPPPGGLPPNNPPGGTPPIPTPPGGGTPPPILPTPPGGQGGGTPPGGGSLGGIGTAAISITAAIQTAQYINQAVDKLADNMTSIATSIIKGDGTEASKSTAKTFQSMVDPLGVNIPLNVAVQSFDALLDINKAILDSTRQNIAFAPRSLQADISGDLQKLIQSIDLTKRLDPTTAELIRANTQFEMAWAEARAKLIESLGPAVLLLLQQLTNQVVLVGNGVQVAGAVANGFMDLNLIIPRLLGIIASNTAPDIKDLDDSDILNQINQFFDATKQKNKMRRNNTFPNP